MTHKPETDGLVRLTEDLKIGSVLFKAGVLDPRHHLPKHAAAPIRIQRQRTKGWKMPENTVYVGRPTIWGNPFPRDHEGVALECVPLGLDADDPFDRAKAATDLYRRWWTGGGVNELIAAFLPRIPKRPSMARLHRELRGKNLACWCKPGDPCHADVLLELANAPTCTEAS